jgi:predicted metalloprotease
VANHASREFVRPIFPASPLNARGSGPLRGRNWFVRAVAVLLLAVVLGGASAPASAAVPNLAPGNAEIDIDVFWRQTLSAAGIAYSSPAVVPFSDTIATSCGTVAPSEYIAFYCLPDGAIYWSTTAYAQAALTTGDAAWVNVMAHEWSHHVQVLLDIDTGWRQDNDLAVLELQATCLGGVYVASALDRDLVTDDMIKVMIAMFAGDASHGTTDQVQNAFRDGLTSGLGACGLDLLPAA